MDLIKLLIVHLLNCLGKVLILLSRDKRKWVDNSDYGLLLEIGSVVFMRAIKINFQINVNLFSKTTDFNHASCWRKPQTNSYTEYVYSVTRPPVGSVQLKITILYKANAYNSDQNKYILNNKGESNTHERQLTYFWASSGLIKTSSSMK